jgi:dTDP-4-dehydrorhamnose reductase
VPGRVIVTGAAGQLGRQLVRAFADAGDEVIGLTRADLDLADPMIEERIASLAPQIVVNSAAWTDVDGCARDPERAMLLNGIAPGRMAAGAARADALFVQISTNEVFDGSAEEAYAEDDAPNPISPYGVSKLGGERAVAAAAKRFLIVRTAWLFGPGGSNFVTKILAAAGRAAASGEPLRVVADEWGNPTWTPALASALVSVTREPFRHAGILHVAGVPGCTRWDWAAVVLNAAGLRTPMDRVSSRDYLRSSTPPLRAVLATSRADAIGIVVGDWRLVTRAYASGL